MREKKKGKILGKSTAISLISCMATNIMVKVGPSPKMSAADSLGADFCIIFLKTYLIHPQVKAAVLVH